MKQAFPFQLAGRCFQHPIVMGILNVTPDSFSDGGSYLNIDSAVQQALKMLDDGAEIIDIGGESTRPGAPEVSLDEELSRTIPVIEAIRQRSDCLISIDTYKAQVMREAVAAGASMINDVCALNQQGALQAAAELQVPVCLMHMQGKPRTMQADPQYREVVADIAEFLAERVATCEQAGLAKELLILDPGFGFGKTLQHNLELLARLEEFHQFGLPILAGMSRKSMFGQLLDRSVEQRLAGSLAGAMLAAQQHAQILRVHDVAQTRDVLDVLEAVAKSKL
ncbi:dihydropteroate synthase [Aliagarivorans marinus]|uniref:dihydropteroate synthase n=1 Tax=Aliagarivorans marinus TaxID=561965 RepID=UPI00042925DA|nr:dihydropteroate synthase [Aliagarivorans marinus]